MVLGLMTSNMTMAQDIHGQPEELVASNEEALAAWSDLKFGMFIHWGIYSTQGSYWDGREIPGLAEHLQRKAELTQDEYAAIANQFYPHLYDPAEWVQLAKDAGMKYIVITSKHHDGFCLFDSAHTDFDMVDATPWGKDLLKPLADACEEAGIKLGFYYSFPDWHVPHPRREMDPYYYNVFEEITPTMETYILNQLEELLTGYGPICELFFDMGMHTPEQSALMAATIHRLQPDCVVNGRVMNNMGDFLTMNDNALPRYPISQAWEAPSTLYNWRSTEIEGWNNRHYDTWAYKAFAPRPAMDVQLDKQIGKLAMITAKGGNFLLNIGPMGDGSILDYEEEVLRNIGKWLEVNGEAVYGADPGPFGTLEGAWCSMREGRLYLLIDDWDRNESIRIPGIANRVTAAAPLADPARALEVQRESNDVIVRLSGDAPDPYVSVVAVDFEGELHSREFLLDAQEAGTVILSGEAARDEIHFENMNALEMPHVVGQSWIFQTREPKEYEVTLVAGLDTKARRQYIEDQKSVFRDLRVDITGLEYTLSVEGQTVPFTLDDAAREGSGDGVVMTLPLGRLRLESGGVHELRIRRSDRERNFRRKNYEPMGIDVQRLILEPVD